MEEVAKTALRTARAHFVEGLSRRAEELRSAVSFVVASPDSTALRAELQRKLHALLASAQLFEQAALAGSVERLITRLAALEVAAEPLAEADVYALEGLIAHLTSAFDVEPAAAAASGVHKLGAAEPAPQTLPTDAPVPLTQTVSGLAASALPARLLLVCSRPHAVRFRELLEDAPIELVHAADAEEAIRLLHTTAPACALLSVEYANLPDLDLVRRLQTDPLGQLGGVHVLLPEGATFDEDFVRQTGADGVLVEPLTAQQITDLVEHGRRRARGGLHALRSAPASTVDEIAGYVAEEIRSGIADSLRSGLHERIALHDTRELMAAAWSAIGRVRSHLAEQSRGRVRFRDDALRELPSFLISEANSPEPEALATLSGKRVLVADDDPAVLWFFSGLLRESGAQVMQALNGREALSLARRKQPHLILTDILMPKVDGFALCREIKRDALLSHVPVILLSWKDDFLDRMRELDAGASGYLRKESGTRDVLAVVCAALRPRQQLAAALRDEGELVGRVEGLGILPLLESVGAERPDAHLVVQDAWNVFEVEIRNGQQLAVTRTAADGSFARGERALLQLLGVNAGRFAVTTSGGELRGALNAPLGEALQTAGKNLAAMLDAVSDTRLLHVALLAFEEEVLEFLLSCTPTRLHEVVARFRNGSASARDLLLDGSFTPAELESHLRELARRGAIGGVWNAEGDDLVGAAKREREEQPGTLLHSSPAHSTQTTWFSSMRPRAAEDELPAAEPAAAQAVADAQAAPQPAAPDVAAVAPAFAADGGGAGELIAAAAGGRASVHEAFEGARLLITLAALVAVGYFGWLRIAPRQAVSPPATPSMATSASAATTSTLTPKPASPRPTTPAPVQPPASVPLAAPPSAPDPTLTLGRILPYIEQSHGVSVGAQQGLLVIEYAGSAPAPRVRVDARELGQPPLAIALDTGRHELVVRRNRDSSFRYLMVRAGETRIITLPL
jgi:DNA-binding response OmpR family regulator